MRSRIVWFVAGSAAGVYTTVKARRAAYRLSAPGVVDQASALGVGWRELSAEIRDGMQTREREIARKLVADAGPGHLDHTDHTDPPELTPPDMRDH